MNSNPVKWTEKPILIEDISKIQIQNKSTPKPLAANAIFLFDQIFEKDEERINELCGAFNNLYISKMRISGIGSGTLWEKKCAVLKELAERIDAGEITGDTVIFIQSHTYSDQLTDELYFSFKSEGKSLHIGMEQLFECVWTLFPDEKKPSFHILGCNSGYYAARMKSADGQVFFHSGKSTISSRVGFAQSGEVLKFISTHLKIKGTQPSTEDVWHHMEGYALQDMALAGKNQYRIHRPTELASWSIDPENAPSGSHKNPRALFEFAMRYRPLITVMTLVNDKDPERKVLRTITESAKHRILFSLVPNRVNWEQYDPHGSSASDRELGFNDSVGKFLYCKEQGLLPKMSAKESDQFLSHLLKHGCTTFAAMLLHYGGLPISDAGKQQALLAAIQSNDRKLVSLLLDHLGGITTTHMELRHVLHVASIRSNAAIFDVLLGPTGLASDNRLLDLKNDEGLSPMEVAIQFNNLEAAERLLAAGANVNTENAKGANLLQQAIFRGSARMVGLLLIYGANIRKSRPDSESLLIKSVRRGQTEIAAFLIEHLVATGQANEVNVPDKDGMPPLLLAASQKNDVMVKMLLKAGADPKARDASGKNILHALSESPEKLIKQLKKKKKNLPKPLAINMHIPTKASVALNSLSMADEFISLGVPLNGIDNHGNTPLMLAAKENNISFFIALLNLGADPNISNRWGYTALHFALQKNNTTMTSKLLEAGIDLRLDTFDLVSAKRLAAIANDTVVIDRLNESTYQ